MSFYETLADKKMRHWLLFNPTKYEEAANYYLLSGDNYKFDRNYKKSREMYLKAADCYEILNETDKVVFMYIKIFQIVTDNSDKIYFGHLIVNLLINTHPQLCADYLSSIAKIENPQDALKSYLKALQLYENDYQKHKICIKIAKIYAYEKNYKQALLYFKQAQYITKNVYIEQLILYQILCLILLKDVNNVQEQLIEESSYKEFIRMLLEAIKSNDNVFFTEILTTYVNTIPFGSCMLSLLIDIKEQLKKE